MAQDYYNPETGQVERDWSYLSGGNQYSLPPEDVTDITEDGTTSSTATSTPVATNYGYDYWNQQATQKVGNTLYVNGQPATAAQVNEVNALYGTTYDPNALANMAADQQAQMMYTAYANPASLVQSTETAQIALDPGQLIAEGTGQLGSNAPLASATTGGQAATVDPFQQLQANTVEAATATAPTQQAVDQFQAAQGEVSQNALMQAATQNAEQLAQLGLTPAQIEQVTQILAPSAREVQQNELISGSAVDMAKVEQQAQMQAAQAQPSTQATVQGQLDKLYADFDNNNPPAWASEAMRVATAEMQERGLGSSSMAGQAVITATLEAATPIAMQDAQTYATFELQNLSNTQEAALYNAQQRAAFLQIDFDQEFQSRVANAAAISEIANLNFTAEQQIALENARLAQTANLANLDAKNAKVLADAAAMTQMELTNLSNMQQAAKANAEAFLQMDFANLTNEQQTEVLGQQAIIQALLTDQAAENAARQFNATSKNQVDQFMASLQSQIEQFNVTQTNAMSQFNAQQVNAVEMFNSEMENQRDQFNAANSLVIAQANAQWRQQLDTINTAELNENNRIYAATVNELTFGAMDQLWQRERDLLEYTFTAAENEADRNIALLVADKEIQAEAAAATSEGIGSLIGIVLEGIF